MLEMLKQNFETKFDIPNFLCFIHMYTAYKVVCKNCNYLYRVTTELTTGIGQGAHPPTFKSEGMGAQVGLCPPPHFWTEEMFEFYYFGIPILLIFCG